MDTLIFEDGREDPRATHAKYSDQISANFRKRIFDFAPTRFIVDGEYVGDPPPVQVGFENINDNIDERFLRDEIAKIFNINKDKREYLDYVRTIQIVRGPHNRHLGLAKVQFATPEAAEKCVQFYHGKQMMGRKLVVELDERFKKIEKKKEEALKPKDIRPIQLQEQLNSVRTPPQTTFQPTSVLPPTKPEVDRPINRLHAPGSLEERIALMGLNQGTYPPQSQPLLQPIQNNNMMPRTQFRQNHIINRIEEKPMIEPPLPPTEPEVENEDDWNPTTKAEEKVHLTSEVIDNEVIPFIADQYIKELIRNIESTSRLKLLRNCGYPSLDKYSSDYKEKSNRIEFEKRRLEQENVKQQQLKNFQHLGHVRKLESKYLGRQAEAKTRGTGGLVRNRIPAHGTDRVADTLKRINRSSALVEGERENDIRRASLSSSDESLSSRTPRSYARGRSRSESRSESSTSSSSSSSQSSNESSSSSSISSRSSSPGTSRSVSPASDSQAFKIKVETSEISTKPSWHVGDKEETAASALLDLKRQPNALEKLEPPQVQLKTKKRKIKPIGQENRVAKRVKTAEEEPERPILLPQEKKLKKLIKPARSKAEIDRLEDDLTFNHEDLDFLKMVHEQYEDEHATSERTKIPFGSRSVNEAHLAALKDISVIENEKNSGGHPKWWNGCSRASAAPYKTEGWKGKVQETAYDDSQKALIKSHVIQAASSTRRDQRNDQRRMMSLNPELDSSYIKTTNTLQMRAKNLRFSRSKIHMWGLFACEKIANGDAVIEYVGEKIRPSVADHRETAVYPKLVTHDGSSYFFRVDSDVIDATLKGNKARFINHSCNPNCIAKVIKHENGSNSIVIYAKQAIEEDEEITYDYKFPREENKIHCRCRAPNCQKYLN